MRTDWDEGSGEFVPPRYRRPAESEQLIGGGYGVPGRCGGTPPDRKAGRWFSASMEGPDKCAWSGLRIVDEISAALIGGVR